MRTLSPNLINNVKRTITFLFATFTLLLITKTSKAQLQACGSAEHLHTELLSDPSLQSRIDAINLTAVQRMTSSNLRTSGAAITIPVVVHVVYNTAAENISDAQIQSQIDVLNEDFNKLNSDTSNIPGAFKPFASDANIQFVLAKQDPSGNATTGITRTATSNTVFTTNSYVKFDAYGGKNAWNTTQYLNIWVCDLSGYGGYSTVPGASASVDGVVISYLCFGRTGTLMSTRNKGRTTTHEVGHWLGLAHTWGWSGTCGDDAINDTPTQEKQNTGVPVFPHVSSCSPNSNGDMFMNYMDYSNDVSRNMFTTEQTAKMNAIISTSRSGLLTSLGAVAPGGSTTTVVACSVPSGLSTSSITSSSAFLNWLSTGATSYNVRYKATTSSTWINITSTTPGLSVSGLNASTVYEFQVASVCSGTSSAFSGSSNFTTAAPAVVCSVPSGLNATSITSVSAVLNWSGTGATSYNVRYKATASSTWNNANTAMTSISISGLNAATPYEFQVASVCSTTSSAFSASFAFTTAVSTTTSSTTTTTSGSVVTIGTSTNIQSNTPYGSAFVKEHTQMIVTKSELVAAGYVSSNNIIKSLSFYVSAASGQTLSNFTIKLMHVSNSEFSNTNFISTGNAVTVYSSNFVTTTGTWNKHVFSSGFAYNGNDNVLIDITWSNSVSSTNSSVYASSSTTNKTLFYGATSKKTNINNVKTGSLTVSRPNMKFEFSSPSAARLANDETSEPTISSSKVEMNLYPNPATTNLNASVSGIKEGSKIVVSIFNIAGSLMGQFEQTADSQEKQIISIDTNFQIENLVSGIYIVAIDADGSRTSQKFILNK